MRLTQPQLADLMELDSFKKISSWESGESFPKIPDLLKISDVLGVSVDQLLKDSVENIENIAPIVEEPKERYVVASQLQEMEKKLLELSKQVSEDREDRETLLKKLEEYEQVILDLKRNYPSPLPE